MEKNNKKLITISEETQIDRPANREMFPIDKIDWRRIRKLVEKIDINSSRWENGAWAMLAISIAVIFEFFNSKFNTGWGIVVGSCIIITLIIFYVASRFSKIRSDSKKEVFSEMDQVEEKTIKAEKGSSIQFKEFEILKSVYGTNSQSIDVTQNLIDNIKDNKLSIIVSNKIGGDPAPSIVKHLKIRYRYQGREYEKIFQEDEKIDLP